MPRTFLMHPRRNFRQTLGACVCAALGIVLGASPAGAQTADPEARPTRGVHLAGAARAGDGDATAVQLNPAQLGFVPAGNLILANTIGRESGPLAGRGLGLYLAAPIFFHGGLGLGLSYVSADPRLGVEARSVFQLGYGLRLGRWAALGASWAHVWDSRFAGTDSFDLGLSSRLGRRLALGLAVEDVGTPRGAGLPRDLPRLWAGELVLRPLGTDRVEVAAGAAHTEGDLWRWIVVRARLAVTVADGLRIFATGDTFPRGTAFAFARGADYQAELGLALDFDHLGLTLAGRGGFPGTGGGGAGGGAAALLRIEGERRPPLAAATFVAQVRLEGVDSDREYLELVRRLRALAFDRDVVAVLLRIENLELGLGRIEELRDLVGALRARGKRVYAYGSFPSTRDYYLATACNGIVLHPAGTLSLTGFSQTVTFYKHAMDQLGVNVDLVRIGEFKGAMEPFIMGEQSAPVRKNKQDLLDDVFGRLVSAVATARGRAGRGSPTMDEARVRVLVDRGLFTPLEAQLVGLVDAVKDDDELEGYLRQTLGRPGITLRDPDPAPRHASSWPGRHVAVVLVDGAIVDGPSHRLPFGLETLAGSDTLVAALEECRQDAAVGAVVLRVNSPGGSAFASDVVARAVTKLRKAGKPVVVSMGDIAASGGYYIAAPADAIFAEPSTLSGSIGIFGYKVDIRKLMGSLGIGVETSKRGQHADYLSPYRPWTDEEIKIAAEKIRHFYELFIGTVAEGRRARGLTRARVDEVGRGHVWTGAQAQGLGLVDQMGGLGAAIDHAAHLGHVPVGRDEQPEVTVLPRPTGGLFEKLAGMGAAMQPPNDVDAGVGAILRARFSQAGMAAAVRLLAPLLLGDGSGVEARVPYDIEIR
jgi:protease IV